MFDSLGELDVIGDSREPERTVRRRSLRDHESKLLAAGSQVRSEPVEQLDAGAAEVLDVAEFKNKRRRVVGDRVDHSGSELSRVRVIDFSGDLGDDDVPARTELHVGQSHRRSLRRNRTSVPLSPEWTSHESAAARMIVSPRPRSFPRGERHLP